MDERIRELRRELQLTQQEFADKLGTSRNNIAGYEIGRRIPSSAVISLICKTFNVSIEWLLSGEGKMFKEVPKNALDALTEEYGLNRFGRIVIEKIAALGEKQWEVLYELITEIVESYSKETKNTAESMEPERDLEAEADAFAAMAREQFLAEFKKESSISSVRESGVE